MAHPKLQPLTALFLALGLAACAAPADRYYAGEASFYRFDPSVYRHSPMPAPPPPPHFDPLAPAADYAPHSGPSVLFAPGSGFISGVHSTW